MFSKIKINNFRCFDNKEIILGQYLTVLSGRNSTGKSTVLGMLGNACELKMKDGVPYLSKQFRAEFSELFIGSKKHDPTGSDKYEIQLCRGQETDYRKFRITWQMKRSKKPISAESTDSNSIKKLEGQERFHIVPYRKDGTIKTSAKFNIPVLYLGLSRLFPIGEANHEKLFINRQIFKSVEHQKWFSEQYNKILSLYDDIIDVASIAFGETDTKKAIGINTDKYDIYANSAGQDNLGQILLALLSFKRIREEQGDKWDGGLLLIDELDSTLHPAAQNKLADLIINQSRELGLQVVITTHSINLLKHVCEKIGYNDEDKNNNIELYYFTNANRALEIHRNIDFTAIESDLLVQSAVQIRHKIKIYSEDAENRWFITKLIPDYLGYVELLDVSLGCQELLNLYSADRSYFGNNIIIFDGDVKDEEFEQVPLQVRKRTGNMIRLPGKVRPEQVIYEYLLSLPAEHPYWSAQKIGFSWTYFKENGPDSEEYKQGDKERDRYKKWFQAHYRDFDSTKLYDYWADDNLELVSQFQKDFKDAYNNIASRLYLFKIPD